MEMHKQTLTDSIFMFAIFTDADEPQPHRPVSAMTTKASAERLAPTGDAGEYALVKGLLVAPANKAEY